MDEKYTPYNHKGTKIDGVEPKHRGTPAAKRGLSNQQQKYRLLMIIACTAAIKFAKKGYLTLFIFYKHPFYDRFQKC